MGGHDRAAEVDVNLEVVPRPEIPACELRVVARDTPPPKKQEKRSIIEVTNGRAQNVDRVFYLRTGACST